MSKTVNVTHIAKLTNIPVTNEEIEKFTSQFETTLATVSMLEELDTKNVEATPQVNNLINVYHEDQIDTTRMFTQEQALANAKQTHHGYFVVPAVLQES